METIEILENYLSLDKNFIKRIENQNKVLNNKEDFFKILKWWLKLTNNNTIGDLSLYSNNTKILKLNIGENSYYLNADSNKSGVAEFIKNKDNAWITIQNENGRMNKITNRNDSTPIAGLYLYKVI
jgi:hypothetical protein